MIHKRIIHYSFATILIQVVSSICFLFLYDKINLSTLIYEYDELVGKFLQHAWMVVV